MKYAVISHPPANPLNPTGATKVHFTCSWAWMARLYVWINHATFADVVHVDTDTAEVIRLIDARDEALVRSDAMTNVLFPLLARTDGGHWATVHAADTVLDDESCAILDKVFS